MQRLDAKKPYVTFLPGATPEQLILPRRYTLTHSDITGNLYLSIGRGYDKKKITKLYARLMRDEVLAELVNNKGNLEFRTHCHVSGGFIVGTARWRYNIFRSELPLALEAIRYGDRTLYEKNPELDHIPVFVYFHSRKKSYNIVERWGTLVDFAK
jgi:hypothetical protein